MGDEDGAYLQKLESEAADLRTKNHGLNTAIASSSYSGATDNNLIEYQLETSELLEQLEHFLRGDFITVDDDGREKWTKQKDTNLVLFNEYGVNSVMSIIGNYLSKHTMLSRYEEMRINEIMADLGDEITIFIYCNYEKMGMDTQFKKTRFGVTVLSLLHAIESAYRRALAGKTSEDINTSKIFTQSDMIGNRMPVAPKKRFNPLNPKTW